MELFIGLMSGTSMDGIDAALVEMENHTLIAGITRPYSAEVKKLLRTVALGEPLMPAVFSQLNTLIGREFAAAVRQLLEMNNISAKQVLAIGSHGQTICHDATANIPYTLQLGCGHTIAEQTGISVVADFRTRDVVVGGLGAPFAPLYHKTLFQNVAMPLAVINIGGIANISYLGKEELWGYDIGPGNCLMDYWAKQHLGKEYDAFGAWAQSGRVIPTLLESLLDDAYFHEKPPKSIGKEYFLTLLAPRLRKEYAPNDVQATLLALTVTTIVRAIQGANPLPLCVALCGGGVHNQALYRELSHCLLGIRVESTDTFGVSPDFLEAMMFAWLAKNTLLNKSLDWSPVTGAQHPAILGAIYAAGIDKRNSFEV